MAVALQQMKWCVLVVLACVVLSALGDLPPPERSYKILILLPVASKSHRNVFMPIANALADRGHKIVMLSNLPPTAKHPNIHEINHGLEDFNTDKMNMFDVRKQPGGGFSIFLTALPPIARKLYYVPSVKTLYEQRKEFDIIIVNHMFNEVAYPFVHEMPFITVSTPGMDYRQSAVLGNVLNPAYAPSLAKEFKLPMNVFTRAANIFFHFMTAIYWRKWAVIPLVQKEISKVFPDLPPLLDIEKNMSLALLNYHYSLEMTYPLLPSQIQVAGMHCKPSKPLPKDLLDWIEGAEHGIIYFSLGSVAKGKTLPVEYRDLFVQAFAQMKQRVIWKYEGELEMVSDNVMLGKWLPQQDILAHPNVKVFITHCGLLSTQEAMYHGTPVLGIPIFGDQPKNGLHMEHNGFGLSLNWEELTVDLIVNSLMEIIQNEKYAKNIAAVANVVKDQMEKPIDRAVWWTEYVVRHQGAPALKCPGADLSWIEYLCLDVIFLCHIVIFFTYWLLKKLWSKMFGKKKQKEE